MMHLICKRFHQTRPIALNITHVHFFSTSSPKPTSHRSNSINPQSLTVSYLLNSCGLPLESAITASKKLQFETADQPDSVLNLLKSYGLKQTNIKNLIINHPLILLADPNKTLKPNINLFDSLGFSGNNFMKLLSKVPRILEIDASTVVEFFRGYGFTEKQIYKLTMKRPSLYFYNLPKFLKPKLEYFKSLGFSDVEIAQMLSCEPYILQRSLEKCIMPSLQVIKRVVGTNDNVLKIMKACGRVLEYDLNKILEPNIAILMSLAVPSSNILKLILLQPRSLLLRTYQFSEVVAKVEKLGFDPTKLLFVLAVRSIVVLGKSWEQKLGVYHSVGLSEEEVLSAFRLQPMCMIVSEKKIRKVMGFFLNELKLKPSMISKNPDLLLYSLEKRMIIPRWSVLQLLMSKDIIKADVGLVHKFKMTEKSFVEKYVSKYQNAIPKVVEAHQGRMQFKGFPIKMKNDCIVTSRPA